EIYSRALEFKQRVEKALESGSRFEKEKLREEIYRSRQGLILFSELEDILRLLTKYGKKSSKRYLGRAISTYKKGKLNRIAAWRARRIKADWRRFIQQKPDVPLMELPAEDFKAQLLQLLYVLKFRLLNRLIQEGGQGYEQAVLMPSLPATVRDRTARADLTKMDEAATILNMDGKAFDLMVARHSALLRKVRRDADAANLPMTRGRSERDHKDLKVLVANSLSLTA
ncbi:MAG: hypothetical protein P8175_01320, partial [Deltaproteobacteria bacterium]